MQRLLDVVAERVAWVLTVPSRSSNAAKLEHLLTLAVAYVVIKKGVELGPQGILEAAVSTALGALKHVPGVAGALDKEKAEILAKIKTFVLGSAPPTDVVKQLPAEGLSHDALVSRLTELRSTQHKFEEGKGSGGIYHLEEGDLGKIQVEAFRLFNCSNALYPGIFPAVRRFEAEVVRMVCTMLNGDDNSCGTLTSGGTESVLMAIKAYRDHALETKGIRNPEIIAACTAHPALDKAAHYFHVKITRVGCDTDWRIDVNAVKKAINSNTIAIYASAPTFPHGAIDDVEALAALAQARGIGLHVDNCLGGFLLSFLQSERLIRTKFDFSVQGVTSISVDLHKYGYASKGASVIAYRNGDLRRAQFCCVPDFAGGLYATPTMQGSRSGAIMAIAWATMMHMGESGYRGSARLMFHTHQRLKNEITGMRGMKLVGTAEASVVAFTSTEFNIYQWADLMSKRGWEIPRLQRPACVHICVTETTHATLDAFLADARACVDELIAAGGSVPAVDGGMAGIYGMAGTVPDRGLVRDLLSSYLDALYLVE